VNYFLDKWLMGVAMDVAAMVSTWIELRGPCLLVSNELPLHDLVLLLLLLLLAEATGFNFRLRMLLTKLRKT